MFASARPRCVGPSSGQAVVTNAQGTVCIDEDIAWLEITVYNVRCMHKAYAIQELYSKVLQVGVAQRLARAYDLQQVCFRGLHNEIHLAVLDKGGIEVDQRSGVMAHAQVVQDGHFAQGVACYTA